MLGIELISYAGVALALLGVYTLVQNALTRNLDEQGEMKRGNVAVALNRGGAYGGLMFAMSGSLVLNKADFGEKIVMFALDGAVAMLVFIIAHYMLDLAVLRGTNNSGALRDGNIAVGITEACAYLALGLIIGASFAGDGDQSIPQGLLSATAFSFIGLITLMVVYTMFDACASILRDDNDAGAKSARGIDAKVTSGDVAAGIDAGSLLLSMGVVLWFSIAGDFQGWRQDLVSYFSVAVTAVCIMAVARLGVNTLLLRGLPSGGVPRALLTAGTTLGVSLITGFVVFVS